MREQKERDVPRSAGRWCSGRQGKTRDEARESACGRSVLLPMCVRVDDAYLPEILKS